MQPKKNTDLIEIIPLPIILIHSPPDQDNRVKFINNQAKVLLKKLNIDDRHFQLENLLKDEKINLNEFIKNQSNYEFHIKKQKSQQIIPLEISSKHYQNDDYLLFIQNKQAEKSLEQKLKWNENHYLNLMNYQSDIICRFLPDGVIVFHNKAFLDFFEGEKDDFFVGKSLYELIPQLHPIVLLEENLTHDNKDSDSIEFQITCNNQSKWLLWSSSKIYEKDAQTIVYQGVGWDITKQKDLENKLIIKNRNLATALKNEKLLFSISNYLNTSINYLIHLTDVFDLVIQELQLKKMAIYLTTQKLNHFSKIIASYSDTESFKTSHDLDFSLERSSMILQKIYSNEFCTINDLELEPGIQHLAHIFLQSAALIPLTVNHRTIGIILYAKDHSYFWRDEQFELLRIITNMISNAWERNDLLLKMILARKKELEARETLNQSSNLASLGVISAGITHEVNQPLNLIKISTDTLLRWQKQNPQILDQYLVDNLNNISSGVERIREIIHHMKDYYHESQSVSDDEIIQVNDVLINSVKFLDQKFFSYNIEKIFKLKNRKYFIRCGKTNFEQIIINIVLNAIQVLDKVKRDKKKIIFKTYSDDENVLIEISDNGTGVPQGLEDKIFNPFFSTKKDKNYDSMGLGLAIVEMFVKRFNGNVSFFNNELGGATFRLQFAKITY